MKKFHIKLTSTMSIIITSIATVITSIGTAIVTAIDNEAWYSYIALGAFFMSISALLIEIVISTHLNGELIKSMAVKNSGIRTPGLTASVLKELEDLVSERHFDIKKIRIICYGTSAYGDFISNMKDGVYKNCQSISLEVMFCSPDNVFMNSEVDKAKIAGLIEDLKGIQNIDIFLSKYLPTIRGCIVYDKNNKAIWNCLQFYSFSSSTVSSARYCDFYALVGTKDNVSLLNSNKEIIEKEFDRLNIGRLRIEEKYECTK